MVIKRGGTEGKKKKKKTKEGTSGSNRRKEGSSFEWISQLLGWGKINNHAEYIVYTPEENSTEIYTDDSKSDLFNFT